MSRIVVFGAGGRAGRKVVAAARGRGHEVVPVVRDPEQHPGLGAVAGDVTEVADVRRLTAGADAVVNAGARMDVPAPEFFEASTHALVEGIGTGRLLVVGMGTLLEVAPGVRIMDGPDFPAEGKEFSDAHVVELELLRASPGTLDWVVLIPPPVFLDEDASEPVPFRVEPGAAMLTGSDPAFSFADLGAAVVAAVDDERLHRTQAAAARL